MVLKIVLEYFNLTKEELLSKNRHQELVNPRHIAMYLVKKKTKVIKPKCEIYLNDIDVDNWMIGQNNYLGMEQHLLPYKFSLIKPFIKKGRTIIKNMFSNRYSIW
jgi:hypothetical protein